MTHKLKQQRTHILFTLLAVACFVLTARTQTYVTGDQVAQAAYDAGFRSSSLVYAVAIADAESSFELDAIDHDSNGTADYGLWQINSSHGYNSSELLSSADYNAGAAYSISGNGTDWDPWVTFYTLGEYDVPNYEGAGPYTSYLSPALGYAFSVDSTVVHAIGDSVKATQSGVHVRNTPGGVAQSEERNSGDTGVITGSYQTAQINGTGKTWIWWQVKWSDGQQGWSAQDYMTRTGTAQPTVAITFATSPAGLQLTVDGTAYATPTNFNWTPGSPHTLSAPTPQYSGLYSRYQFTGAQNQTITTPNSGTTYTANFATQYDLTVGAGPGGTVGSSSGWYGSGVVVPISAAPNFGYSFSGWTGSGWGSYSGSSSSASATMNGPVFETANFSPNPTAVTIASSPSGLSLVVDNQSPAITTPATFNWTSGSLHTVSATTPQYSADSHTQYSFSSWSDSQAQSHSITVPSSATTYTATYSTRYLLNTVSSPPAGGTITPSPAGPWYNPGQTVSLTANASAGYTFGSWSGVDSSSGSTASVTMNGYRNVTANFTPNPTVISDTRMVGQTLNIDVSTTVGSTYTLEYKDSLADANWTSAQSQTGTGGIITLSDNTATSPARFYRVRVQ